MNNANELVSELAIVHPHFTPEEWDIAKTMSVKDMKSNKEIPMYLRIREAVRRCVRKSCNGYKKIAIDLHNQLCEALSSNVSGLTKTYVPRDSGGYLAVGSNRRQHKAGELDDEGRMYVPLWRAFFPPEEYAARIKISNLKTEWIKRTYNDAGGKGHNIGEYRVARIADGTAEVMIIKHGLKPEHFLDELCTTYHPRKQSC